MLSDGPESFFGLFDTCVRYDIAVFDGCIAALEARQCIGDHLNYPHDCFEFTDDTICCDEAGRVMIDGACVDPALGAFSLKECYVVDDMCPQGERCEPEFGFRCVAGGGIPVGEACDTDPQGCDRGTLCMPNSGPLSAVFTCQLACDPRNPTTCVDGSQCVPVNGHADLGICT